MLDGSNIPFEDIKRNMHELEIINRKLGGHRVSLDGLGSLLKRTQGSQYHHIVEIGCGGGDNLRVMKEYASNHHQNFKLSGIDINPECIAYASGQRSNEGIDFICSDYKDVKFETRPDIIFSSLFCHHFTDHELVEMLRWMRENTSTGFFINDLHRHALAYYSIKWLTQGFSKSYLVKHDAPLSVQRGFTRKDWSKLFHQAGIRNYDCQWKWAFRWLVIYNHGAEN